MVFILKIEITLNGDDYVECNTPQQAINWVKKLFDIQEVGPGQMVIECEGVKEVLP